MIRESKAITEGFITDDAEVQKTEKTGKPFIMFSIAIPHYRIPGEPPRVSFVEVEAWDKLAKECSGKIKKGVKIRVTGRLKQDIWQENNKLCSRIKVYGDKIEFL